MASSPKFEKLDPSSLYEEETLRGYKAERFYPVKLGEVFNERYRTIGKLGYGSASTVWLCQDLNTSGDYVALKVCVNSSKIHRELSIYNHINELASEHAGRYRVRKMLDSFEIEGPHGKHICLALKPMGRSLDELRKLSPGGVLQTQTIRDAMRPILNGLQFLHNDAQIIHTDLQPNNMLVGIHDFSTFAKYEKHEAEDPSPRKELDGRTIFISRRFPFTKGAPSISDLSEARFSDSPHNDLIMPNVYRAPEVILGMQWDKAVDIWGFGMTLWDLFEPKRLFEARDSEGQYSESHHLAQMIAVLGPPPLDFLQRSKRARKFWDENGDWKGDVPIPDISAEGLEKRLQGEEKMLFLTFMRKMLQWRPEDRGNCEEVFFDEWLLADLIESGEIVRDDE